MRVSFSICSGLMTTTTFFSVLLIAPSLRYSRYMEPKAG